MFQTSKFKIVLLFFSVLLLLVLYYYFDMPERLERGQRGVNRGVTLEENPVEGMYYHEVIALLESLEESVNLPPRNAYLDRETSEIVPEVVGQKLDIRATADKVINAPPHTRVLLQLVELDPEITAAHYRRINRQTGVFHTWIGGGGGRATNIILATASINNYLLFPGEIFSFNQANGPRTFERGYQLAPIIVGDSVVPGLGGGVCQVSTTLYNAVLEAGMEVVERYPHSQPVGYVPPGRDATVSDYLDFKFRNNTDGLVLIKSSSGGGSIEFRIFQE